MSTYDQIVQYGEKRGEKRGELNSKIQVILNAFDNDIKIDMIANITKMSLNEVKEILESNGRDVNSL
jgi:hypothetical protein